MTDLARLPFDDAVAVEIQRSVHAGDTARLGGMDVDLATVRIIDNHGTRKTLLHVATDWPGHYPGVADTIAWLAQAGVPVNEPASNPNTDAAETPLHWAASSDDVAAIDALVTVGADLEAPGAVFTLGTPMSDAVVFRKWAAAAALLRHGAQVTPWQAAGLGLLQPLRRALPDLTPAEANGALWHACRGGHLRAVQELCAIDADLDWVGPMEWTPRRAAVDSENAELLDWLKSR